MREVDEETTERDGREWRKRWREREGKRWGE
jgi:hypothetical protein